MAYLDAPAAAPVLLPRARRTDCGYCPAGSRDSECPQHGLAADGRWWRTPAHLRGADPLEADLAARDERDRQRAEAR